MSKYLFRALNAVTDTGPGPTLWFQSPTTFHDMAAQVLTTGGASSGFNVAVEVTLNGEDFRAVPVGFPPNNGNIVNQMFGSPVNGGYAHLGPVGLMMGFRLNLILPLSSGSLTILLAIDQED